MAVRLSVCSLSCCYFMKSDVKSRDCRALSNARRGLSYILSYILFIPL